MGSGAGPAGTGRVGGDKPRRLIKQRPEANEPLGILQADALLPQRLAQWCDAHGARLIHISMDCVFSGLHRSYSEADTPDPVDLYAGALLGFAPTVSLQEGVAEFVDWAKAERGATSVDEMRQRGLIA